MQRWKHRSCLLRSFFFFLLLAGTIIVFIERAKQEVGLGRQTFAVSHSCTHTPCQCLWHRMCSVTEPVCMRHVGGAGSEERWWLPLCVLSVIHGKRVWNGCAWCCRNVVTSEGLGWFCLREEEDNTNICSSALSSPHQSVCSNLLSLRSLFLSRSFSPSLFPSILLSLSFCLAHLSSSIFIPSPTELTSGSYWQSEQPLSHKSLTESTCLCVWCVYVCAPGKAWQTLT